MSVPGQKQEPATGLERLLELEADIASRVSAAHEEADRAIAEASTDSQRGQTRLVEELAEASRSLADRSAAEHLQALAAIEERAGSEAATLDAVDETSLRRVAAALFERWLDATERAE